MKISNLLFILAFTTSMGCNTLKKQLATKTENVPNNTLPDDYTVTGTTTVDYQVVQPVRCVDSDIQVRVKTPGATDFRLLNRFEYKADSSGPGGGGIWLQRRADATFDSNGNLIYLVFYGVPVAPVGTQYEIRSTLKASNHELY